MLISNRMSLSLEELYYHVQDYSLYDFPSFIQDDVFEDSIVDFFETADVDRDGILEYTDFYSVRRICTL